MAGISSKKKTNPVIATRERVKVDARMKQEHKDVIVRNVLTCVQGVWSKYENLLRAKTILLPENQDMIYVNTAELEARCPKQYYTSIMRDFGLETMNELWDHLMATANDPYATVQNYRDTASDDRFKPLKKLRTRRALSYRMVFDKDNQQMLSNYFGLPPQAREIIDIVMEESTRILENNPGKAVIYTEEELQVLLEAQKDRLQTKQASWRIFQYYRGKMIQYGFLRYAK
jgi:hypothetical protein